MSDAGLLEAIRARHYRNLGYIGKCNSLRCRQPWPCDTAQILARFDAAEARERALREALRVGEHLRLAGQAYWEEPSALTRSDFEQAAIAWDVAADPLLTEPLEGEL